VDWNNWPFLNPRPFLRWQLPYQVIVDWNYYSVTESKLFTGGDNYLIRWLWIETAGVAIATPTKSCDNYLIRWLWIETGIKEWSASWGKWQLPYQVIVDWNPIPHRGSGRRDRVTITLSGDCGLKLIPTGRMKRRPRVTITLSGDCGLKPASISAILATGWWQLPYQVIVDWNVQIQHILTDW